MTKAIFITVRTSSTRLPEKCLLEIGGIKNIVFLIRRLKKSKYADKIILCTTENKADDILCDIASEEGILYFRGSEKDKLERWLGAVNKYNIDFFVTADGDDLFCEPELIDLAFQQFERTNPDFIQENGLIVGSFTYAIKSSALKKVCQIKDSDDTEMMWVYFTKTGLFKVEELLDVPAIYKRPEIRMTLDYDDDFKFFKTIIEHFYDLEIHDFDLRDIVNYLDENPSIIKINQYLQKEFLENQKRKTNLKIKNKEFNNE